MKKETTESSEATLSIRPLALRPREAARALGVGQRVLWFWTNQNLVPHVRMNKVIWYPVLELQRWLSEETARGRQP